MQIRLGLTAAATGTADAITATFSPAPTALVDRMVLFVTAASANATSTPTFSPNGLTAHTITKLGGSALAAGDILGSGHVLLLQYNLAGTRWELLNPSKLLTNSTLAQVLANGNATGELSINSDNANGSLQVMNTYVGFQWNGTAYGEVYATNTLLNLEHDLLIQLTAAETRINGNFKFSGEAKSETTTNSFIYNVAVGSSAGWYSGVYFESDNQEPTAYMKTMFVRAKGYNNYAGIFENVTGSNNVQLGGSYYALAVNGKSYITDYITLANLTASRMLMLDAGKNVVESSLTESQIATQSFVDSRLQSNIKIIGDWDATSGSYPLNDESNTTPFITQWGSTIKAGWAFRVGYGQAGTVDGFYYENGDVVYALIDSATDTSADWGDLDHNLQQATESTRGTAKIVTNAIIDDETTTENESIVTSYKLWSRFWPRVLAIAHTFAAKITFTSAPRFSSTTASQRLEVDANKDLISVAKGTADNKDFGTGTSNIPEIGATLGSSKVVETNASGKLITADKNTAFNKNLGRASGTVLEGDDPIARDTDILIREALGSAIKASNLPIQNIVSSQAMVPQRCYFIPIYLKEDATLTGVKWYQDAQGVYTANNYNGIGLYSYSNGTLTLVASSTNDGNVWKGASNSIQSKAFSSTYSATRGLYFIAPIWSASATTTAPAVGSDTLRNLNISSMDFTNSAKLYSQISSLTSLPSTQAMSGTTGITTMFWMAVY